MIDRRQPVKRGKPPRRRTPLPRYKVPATLRRFSRWVHGRAGGWCEVATPVCPPGRHRGHQAHHVIPRGRGGDDDPGNGLWCCAAGHRWIHTHVAEATEEGWLRTLPPSTT